MRRSLPAAILLGLAAVGLALAGCAQTPGERPAPTGDASPAPDPSPTVEAIAVGPGEVPPTVFGGDCGSVLSAADLADVLGADAAPAEVSPPQSRSNSQNAGGLMCRWTTSEGSLEVGVIPRAGLGDAEFPDALVARYFEECNDGWFCSRQGGDDEVWFALTFTDQGMSQADVEAKSEVLAPRLLANHAAAGDEPWTRDRTGWWPALDCDGVAAAVGARWGSELTGEPAGLEHLPLPIFLMSAEGAGAVDCTLADASGATVGRVVADPGLGVTPFWASGEQVDLGLPGITAVGIDLESDRPVYIMSDGVNRAYFDAVGTPVGAAESLAVAVAAAAEADFE